jgi:hypothetical protein
MNQEESHHYFLQLEQKLVFAASVLFVFAMAFTVLSVTLYFISQY